MPGSKVLVYSPEVRILIENVDVTQDIVRGTVSRITGGASSLQFTLSNKDLRYNDRFRRMDRVVVYLKRVKPILVFSGYLDVVPGLQLYPTTVTFKASCTIKRILYTLWDPGLDASLQILNQRYIPFGKAGAGAQTSNASPAADPATGTNADAPAPATTPPDTDPSSDNWFSDQLLPNLGDQDTPSTTGPSTPNTPSADTPTSGGLPDNAVSSADEKDSGLGNMLKNVLNKVGGWPMEQLHVQEFPESFLGYIQERMPDIENLTEDAEKAFKELFEFDEAGTTGAAGGGTGGGGDLGNATFTSIGPPANGSAYSDDEMVWIVKNAGWTGEDVPIGASIMKAESSGRPNAENLNSNGTYDRGLWQINDVHNSKLPGANRYDPAVSTQLARMIYQESGSWQPWSTYSYHGTYTQHMDSMRAAAARGGTAPPGSGTSGGGAAPAPSGGATRMPGGAPMPGTPGNAAPTGGGGSNQMRVEDFPPMPSRMGSEANWQPDTIKVARVVAHKWPELQTIGGWRPSDPYPDHPSGRAADIMIPNYSSPQGVKLGDDIAAFLHANAGALGIQYTIWKQYYQPIGGQGNQMEDRGSPTQNHFDHIHVTTHGNAATGGMLDGSTSGGTPGAPTGGGAGGQSTFQNKLAKNIFTYLFNPKSYIDTMSRQLKGRYASLNDQSLIEITRALCDAGMREFQSAPNGDFLAFYPDYFGLDGTAPVLKLEDVECKDVRININDDALTTHVFTMGANTMEGTVNITSDLGYLSSPGVVTVEDKWLFDRATEGFFFEPDFKTAEELLRRYGPRRIKKQYPNIYQNGSPEAMLLVAIKLFMQKWAEQFQTSVDLTFMPELFPGMRVELVGHDLVVYVKSVTHQFDFESGFTTTAQVMAPMSASKSPTGRSSTTGTGAN